MIIKEKTVEYILKSEKAKENPSVFVLKAMSAGEANDIDDETTMFDRKGQTRLLVGSAKKKKIERCLVDWKNVKNEKGEVIPCNLENKLKMPSMVQDELIDEINRISYINADEEKNL